MKVSFRSLLRRLAASALFILMVTLFVVVILWESVVITIPSGHGGVLWYRFFDGTTRVPGPPLREGVRAIFPWDKVFIYNMRLQSQAQNYQVVSKDGLHFEIKMNYRWEVVPRNIPILQRHIGPDYEQNLLIPEIGSVTRHVVSRFTAVEVFSDRRADVQKLIYDEIVATSLHNGIGSTGEKPDTTNVVQLNNILVKDVVLPEQIRTAIENKLKQAQVVEEYQFRVARERLESQRKAVEAEGIRRFQEIVTPAITDSYLRWRGIEATLKLAQSPNSKVIVIGNGPGGLPIILDTTGRQTPPAVQMPDRSPVEGPRKGSGYDGVGSIAPP
jgi:prohibitin 1